MTHEVTREPIKTIQHRQGPDKDHLTRVPHLGHPHSWDILTPGNRFAALCCALLPLFATGQALDEAGCESFVEAFCWSCVACDLNPKKSRWSILAPEQKLVVHRGPWTSLQDLAALERRRGRGRWTRFVRGRAEETRRTGSGPTQRVFPHVGSTGGLEVERIKKDWERSSRSRSLGGGWELEGSSLSPT